MKIMSTFNSSDWVKKEDTNRPAESQIPPIVDSGSFVRKNQEIPRNKHNGQENKKGNKRPVVENNKKSAFEILMEED